MKKYIAFISLLLSCTSAFVDSNFSKIDTYTIKADQDYLSATSAKNKNGTINAIIEIPTGSNEKWEVSKIDGSMIHWELKNGQRVLFITLVILVIMAQFQIRPCPNL